MNGHPQQQHVDSLSLLYKAHTALAHIMMQVDGLVLKAHKITAHRQISGLDLCNFSQFLADTAFSLQEWIPRFEDAIHRVPMEDQEHKKKDSSASLHEKKGRNDEEHVASQDKSWCHMLSENLAENLLDVRVDDTAFMDTENMLSDSPLVPWLDRVQFFILTPMAKHKKDLSPVLLRRCSFKDQESLQSSPPSTIASPGVSHACTETMETIPAPGKASRILSFKSSAKKEESISDNLLVSVPSTPSRLQHHSFESPNTMDITTPLPPQSLVKRYSNFFEADEHFADSSPLLLITPVVEQNQASQHNPAKEEEEGTEITEYFTVFSPPRSITPCVSTSERGPCSLSSELLSPQDQAVASASHLCHERLPRNVGHSTPLPPQSLMKRYSRFLHAEKDGDEMPDSIMMLTPMLVSSPPKTCILMRPNHKEDTMKPRHRSQTPLLLLRSPFRTPGLFLKKAVGHACYEDMELTSLKKPGQPPRCPESARRTPSSDMQFATMRRAPASSKRIPLVNLQLSTVRKPGAPLPGEQTLKRELWCRMEAEFTSMAHVCKSLFTENQPEASAEVGIECRQQQGLFVPRGLQQRGLNL